MTDNELKEPKGFADAYKHANDIDSLLNSEPEGIETQFDWGDIEPMDLEVLNDTKGTGTQRVDISLEIELLAQWHEFVEVKTGVPVKQGRASLSSKFISDAMRLYMAVIAGFRVQQVAEYLKKAVGEKNENAAKNLREIASRMEQRRII